MKIKLEIVATMKDKQLNSLQALTEVTKPFETVYKINFQEVTNE